MNDTIENFPKKINDNIIGECLSNNFSINGILDFNREEEKDFFVDCLNKGYEASKSALLSIKDIDTKDISNLSNLLSKSINLAVKFENTNKTFLEKNSLEEILKLFEIPEDTIDFSINLEDNFDQNSGMIQLSPEDLNIDLSDYKEYKAIKFDLGKRYLNNMLIAGISSYYTLIVLIHLFKNGIISKENLLLYIKILSINDFLLYYKDNVTLTEHDKKEIGSVDVKLGNEDKRTFIKSRAKILPILIYETIKGIFELISTHSLPLERKKALAIIKKSDCVENEIWYMRIGPVLWENLRSSLPESEGISGMNSKKLPYLILKIITLPKMQYIRFMKELIHGTKKCKRIVKSLYDDIEYSSFVDRLNIKKKENDIIQDELLKSGEL